MSNGSHLRANQDTPSAKPHKYPRISRPTELLRPSYDVVVVGSGYGGSVAASRMSRAGQKVCVLERGKERWPGEYPYKAKDVMKEMNTSGQYSAFGLAKSKINSGKPTNMYHMILGEGQSVLVGGGLGGTSLINANIFLRADERTMRLPYWPKELQEPEALNDFHHLAEQMLQPESYPQNWPSLPKLSMLENQAKAMDQKDNFSRPLQTTTFRDGHNSSGVYMHASRLTGQDLTGLNDGSKSSTLVNYLSDAWNWGAEMFCECEVRYITKHSKGGYLIFFAWHGGGRDAFLDVLYEDLMFVHAESCVFLGAGSLGTTEILLRSKERGLHVSDRVGRGMSGNGDLYAFAYNCNTEVNSLGKENPDPTRPVGPTISGMIDNRAGSENVLDGYVIQEGAAPEALAYFCQNLMEFMPHNDLTSDLSSWYKLPKLLPRIGSRIFGPYYKNGSVERTQIYLVMSHDTSHALLTLEDDKPHIQFRGAGRSDHVEQIHKVLAKATQAVDGTYVDNPWYTIGQQALTVHPIGGACMSNDGSGVGGATNHFGEVYIGDSEETHDGLIVTDGAAIPCSLGANPLATIAALAERSVKQLADRKGWTIDYETKNGILDFSRPPIVFQPETEDISRVRSEIEKTSEASRAGVRFSEVMKGFLHVGQNLRGNKRECYEAAARIAKSRNEAARLFVSIKSYDIDTLTKRGDHSALLTGTLTCPSLPGSPFMISRGSFRLFTEDESTSCTKNLIYDFDMRASTGEICHFRGFKAVDSSVVFSPSNFWKATSTLYVTVTKANGVRTARGILNIRIFDLFTQMKTLAPSGPSFVSKTYALFAFASYFLRQSANAFFKPVTSLEYQLPHPRGFTNITTHKETILTASDGVASTLHSWEPTSGPKIPVLDLLMIPGAAVDHQIFSLATISHNAVQYFTAAGYRVHVIVHRIGGLRQIANNWTTYDARLDIKAALEHLREHNQNMNDFKETNESGMKTYVIAHCMGSVAFSCGLLDGTIPAAWIKGVTCSQVFMNPIWSAGNMIKTKAPVKPDGIYKRLAGNWFACEGRKDGSLVQRSIDELMRIYPDQKKELCTNVACHRCTLVFGRFVDP